MDASDCEPYAMESASKLVTQKKNTAKLWRTNSAKQMSKKKRRTAKRPPASPTKRGPVPKPAAKTLPKRSSWLLRNDRTKNVPIF